MNINNPYKGLFPYKAEDESIFFGREKETSDLMELIQNNQLVILYGESGTGKTSLINAKLFPELKRKYYFPIYIRINFINGEDPLIQLRKTIFKELKKWDDEVPDFETHLTLVEYASKTSVFDGLIKPVLFFDQFEELFTLAPRYIDSIFLENFIDQISNLIEVKIPKHLEMQHQQINDGFVNDNKAVDYYERNDGNHTIQQYRENILKFSVVFSLRQDYIAQLDDLRFNIPSISTNRYRIKRFTDSQAYDAIIKPTFEFLKASNKLTSIGIIGQNTVNEIVHQLKVLTLTNTDLKNSKTYRLNDVFIQRNIFKSLIDFCVVFFRNKKNENNEISDQTNVNRKIINSVNLDPTILSLYCFQLFEDAKKLNPQIPEISFKQVISSPCNKIIKSYYDLNLSDRKIKRAVEELLITPDGRRILMPLQDFSYESKISETEVQGFKSKSGIIRIYGEHEEQEIELAHDQIAKVALMSKKSREANFIKRNAVVLLLFVISLAFLIILSSLLYISEKEKHVNIQDLNGEIRNLKLKNENQLAINSSLEAKNDDLRKQSDLLQIAYRAVLSNRYTLITDNEEINKGIAIYKKEIKNLTNEKKLLESMLEDVKTENKRISLVNKDLQHSNRNLTDSLNFTNSRLYQTNNELSITNRSKGNLESDYNKLKSQMLNLEKDLNKYISKLELRDDEVTKAHKTIKNLETENAGLQNRISAFENKAKGINDSTSTNNNE